MHCVTRARQRGLLASTGDILCYVDADTRPPAGWTEQIRDQFGRDPGLACLSGPYSCHDLSSLRNALASGWFVLARRLYASSPSNTGSWRSGLLAVA